MCNLRQDRAEAVGEALCPEPLWHRMRFWRWLKQGEIQLTPQEVKDLLGKAGISGFQRRKEFLDWLKKKGIRMARTLGERFFTCLFQGEDASFQPTELFLFWVALLCYANPSREALDAIAHEYKDHPRLGYLVTEVSDLDEWMRRTRGRRTKNAPPEELQDREERKRTFATLKEMRRQRGLSQKELALRCGLRRDEISKIENGLLHGTPQKRLAKLRAYLRGVGITDPYEIDAILGYSGLILYALCAFRTRRPTRKLRRRRVS